MSQFRGGGRIWRWFAHDLSSGDTLWQSLGLELTVGMGVENSGHFAGFISKEPFHPTVFPAEERLAMLRMFQWRWDESEAAFRRAISMVV